MVRSTALSRKSRSTTPFEALEGRRMMSATPYVVNGTTGNDAINVSYGLPLILAAAKATPSVSNTSSLIAIRNPIIGVPTIRNMLTVTVNGVSTSTFLQTGQQVIVNGSNGNDIITVSGGVSVTVNGGFGNDVITTSSGNDTLNGEAGDDTLDGGLGGDVINGGAGIDTVTYASRTASVNVSLDGVANDGQSGEGDNVSSDIEVVQGGSGNDVLSSNSFDTVARTFRGGAGNDTISGGQGNDTIFGDAGNDFIAGWLGNDVIHGGAGDDTSAGGSGNDILFADSGTDYLYGDDGMDQLHGGAGTNYLYGGDGNDILITLGGSHNDREYGNGGTDTFWLDAEPTESVMDANSYEASHNVHRVAAFDHLHVNGTDFGAPSREMNIGNLVDPSATVHNSGQAQITYGYANFSSTPLFNNGTPIANDINQGNVGDCYFLASLSAVAKTNPDMIRQSVVDLGDGTYAVQLKQNGSNHFIRVDADLPVTSWGSPAFDHFGATTSLWAPIMEKAWAFFRNGSGTYQSISSGWPSEAFNAMGMSNSSYNPHGFLGFLFGESAQDFGNHVANLLNGGNAVTLCTSDGGGVLEGGHCYMVDHVSYSNGSVSSITVRNPWGTDGAGGDSVNDGYITLSLTRGLAAADTIAWGHV